MLFLRNIDGSADHVDEKIALFIDFMSKNGGVVPSVPLNTAEFEIANLAVSRGLAEVVNEGRADQTFKPARRDD